MLSIDKVQKSVDNVLYAFTNAIYELDRVTDKLNAEINKNKNSIAEMQAWNAAADDKIVEYQKLKTNIEGILK